MIKSVKCPPNLKRIEDDAFSYNPLEHLELNHGLETIGNHAFAGCHLTSINIPSSVISIGRYAFATRNVPISSIVFNNNSPHLEEIQKGTFRCHDRNGAKKFDIYLPSSIKTIQTEAFRGLRNITVHFEEKKEYYNIAKDAFEATADLRFDGKTRASRNK